jgi:hypothetical protein
MTVREEYKIQIFFQTLAFRHSSQAGPLRKQGAGASWNPAYGA